MTRTILGVFSDRANADQAIDDLEHEGFDHKDISIIMRGEVKGGSTKPVAEGAAAGITTGGVLGGIAGLLVGVGALAIPGIGPLLVGGPIAAALGLTGAAAATVTGAVTGAVAGGLVGSLMGIGVPEKEAREYEQRIQQGAILLAIPTIDKSFDKAYSILKKHGAEQIRTVSSTQG